jgi:DNA-binding transcriptional ArsR family regulator
VAKSGPSLIDRRLMKAVSNPTRVDILNILMDGPSSPSKIARRLDNVDVNLASHHIKVLRELGCVELVREIKHGGRTEHVYKATKRHYFSTAEWEAIAPKDGHPITIDILRMISENLGSSLVAGDFDRKRDRHLSRSPINVDQEGWAEVGRILQRALEEVHEVAARSAERAEHSGEELVKICVVLIQILSADQASERPDGSGAVD